MRQVFLERADFKSPAFKAWFKKSKVVEPDGTPAVVYHGTNSLGDFQVFRQNNDIGHHFGTAKAANDRLDFRDDQEVDNEYLGGTKMQQKFGGQRIYPVYLSIQKPFEMPDMGHWEPNDVVEQLEEQGFITGEDDKRYRKEIMAVLTTGYRARGMEAARKLLQKLGFDGIRYQNESEDQGSTSWIALDPRQIKSIHNRGTFDPRRGSIME